MTKYLLFGAATAALFLGSCNEKGPAAIDFSKVQNSDTTYTAPSVEAPQARNVLVEEFTGVQCTNCPAGTDILDGLQQSNPNRVMVISLHGGSLTAPIEGHSHVDLSNITALELVNSFGENPAKPAACIDRTQNSNNEYFISRNFWEQVVADRLGVSTPVNLTVSSSYNGSTLEAVIKVKVSYTGQVTKKQNLSVVIIESGIVDAQDFPTYVDDSYTHNHVFRAILTPLGGASFLDDLSAKEPGRVYERTIVFPVNAAWDLNNCHVVAFVHDNESNDKEVAQVAEAPLK